MPLDVQPDVGGAEATPGDMLSFIQFQLNGTDLGGPDVDTVNFRTGTGTAGTVTRGTGETANVLTVHLT
jgi:hypothetical protein